MADTFFRLLGNDTLSYERWRGDRPGPHPLKRDTFHETVRDHQALRLDLFRRLRKLTT
jgi:hypothetical protein